MCDIIGDIHGHANALINILEKLGYDCSKNHYSHPHRKIIFVGDFIDRGKQIRETLELVRPMVENGAAFAVMGNHEFNAIMYHTRNPNDNNSYLRKHNKKNTGQHAATLSQLSPEEISEYIEWFKTLPLWLDLDGLRVVHACWDFNAIKTIGEYLKISGTFDEFLLLAAKKGSKIYQSVEDTHKGKEIPLPEDISFEDKDGNKRKDIRVKWFYSGENKTYADFAFSPTEGIPDVEIPHEVIKNIQFYPLSKRPVFCGHYWLSDAEPSKLTDNIACLDYSVAKDGFLCAYRWHGEKRLNNRNFVTTKNYI